MLSPQAPRTRDFSKAQSEHPVQCLQTVLIMISTALMAGQRSAMAGNGPAWRAYLPIEIIARELHRRVGYYPYTIGTVPSHKSSPALVSPHLHETLPDRQLVFRPPGTLYLEQDLEALEW